MGALRLRGRRELEDLLTFNTRALQSRRRSRPPSVLGLNLMVHSRVIADNRGAASNALRHGAGMLASRAVGDGM